MRTHQMGMFEMSDMMAFLQPVIKQEATKEEILALTIEASEAAPAVFEDEPTNTVGLTFYGRSVGPDLAEKLREAGFHYNRTRLCFLARRTEISLTVAYALAGCTRKPGVVYSEG